MDRLFFDCEFTGLHKNTTIISIGIVDDLGNRFYAEFNDYDISQLDEWLENNVISNLKYNNCSAYYSETKNSIECKSDKNTIRGILKGWLSRYEKIEFWSDCLAYDWVLFIDLFGTAFDLPENVYIIPFDISTLFKTKGLDANIDREMFANQIDDSEKHNALWDALIIKKCYDKLQLL